MAELLLELYSEEIPPQLQISARSQIKQFIENSLHQDNVKYKELSLELKKRGMKLIMDYVLNHWGLNHYMVMNPLKI